MADRSVAAWNELHESEASEASVFCFDNAFIVKSWLFVDLAPVVQRADKSYPADKSLSSG